MIQQESNKEQEKIDEIQGWIWEFCDEFSEWEERSTMARPHYRHWYHVKAIELTSLMEKESLR